MRHRRRIYIPANDNYNISNILYMSMCMLLCVFLYVCYHICIPSKYSFISVYSSTPPRKGHFYFPGCFLIGFAAFGTLRACSPVAVVLIQFTRSACRSPLGTHNFFIFLWVSFGLLAQSVPGFACASWFRCAAP